MQRNAAVAKIVRKPKRTKCCDDMIIHAALQDKSEVGDVARDGIVDLVLPEEFDRCRPPHVDLQLLLHVGRGRQADNATSSYPPSA